jgi:hypothetical protein
MPLNVQAIAQAQMPEFIVIQFAVEEAPRLIPKLGDSLIDQRFVHRVIAIHTAIIGAARLGALITSGYELITMHDGALAFRQLSAETVIRSAAENPAPAHDPGST